MSQATSYQLLQLVPKLCKVFPIIFPWQCVAAHEEGIKLSVPNGEVEIIPSWLAVME